ncbi:MAG: amidohydrolase family protein [Myxococcota bacterium]|nr:amidohydrolase family protein [Myxococcota bacterium]
MRRFVVVAACLACGRDAKPRVDDAESWKDPAATLPTLTRRPARDRSAARVESRAPVIAIRNATIMTATGSTITDGTIVLSGGAITALGPAASTRIPDGARVVDGKGKFVTPGIIDTHSHIGVYAAPSARANDDGNEASAPVTAQARAQYAYSPQDPQISRAAQGGVTTALILPGSANLIGGEGFTVTMRQGRTSDEVAFPGAPATIKMACGENPKRVYKEKAGPNTRMGEYSAFRTAFHEARAYVAKQLANKHAHEQWQKKKKNAKPGDKPEPAPEPVAVDLKLEALASVLRKETLVQIHCYKASDIAEMVAIADEFGFKIRSFHHALEAYKVRDLLVAKDIAINTWSDWWGFKLEAFDGIPENAALFFEQGGRPTIHSDSALGIQRLNQDAAKAMAAGRAAGIEISDDAALRWVTANAAWVLGIDDVTGTLEVGKRADVAVWSGSPMSAYSRTELVIAGGLVSYEREKGLNPSDFELGTTSIGEVTR